MRSEVHDGRHPDTLVLTSDMLGNTAHRRLGEIPAGSQFHNDGSVTLRGGWVLSDGKIAAFNRESMIGSLPAAPAQSRSRSTPEVLTMPSVDVDELLERLSATNPHVRRDSTWGVALSRAAEHIVADTSTSAATAGGFPVADTAWRGRIEDLFVRRLRLLSALPLVVEHTGGGEPLLPAFDDIPTAAAQGGEKKELASDAFTVGEADPETIDSTLYLNVSLQLDRVLGGFVEAMLTYAVAAQAEAQTAAALVEVGTTAATLDAGMAAFDGPLWVPDMLLVAPSDALALAPYIDTLSALEVRPMLVPSIASSVLLDSRAVVGWFARIESSATEPAVMGRQYARAIYGKLGATAAGVQVLTAISS
ncbi:MAG: hypothetical protein KDB37_11160 [Ilumatobacter sp.]|nr:hypothetical protein [Ilumatobacter sp.]